MQGDQEPEIRGGGGQHDDAAPRALGKTPALYRTASEGKESRCGSQPDQLSRQNEGVREVEWPKSSRHPRVGWESKVVASIAGVRCAGLIWLWRLWPMTGALSHQLVRHKGGCVDVAETCGAKTNESPQASPLCNGGNDVLLGSCSFPDTDRRK